MHAKQSAWFVLAIIDFSDFAARNHSVCVRTLKKIKCVRFFGKWTCSWRAWLSERGLEIDVKYTLPPHLGFGVILESFLDPKARMRSATATESVPLPAPSDSAPGRVTTRHSTQIPHNRRCVIKKLGWCSKATNTGWGLLSGSDWPELCVDVAPCSLPSDPSVGRGVLFCRSLIPLAGASQKPLS